MTDIITVNKAEDNVISFDELNYGDLFKVEGDTAIYLKLPHAINFNEIEDYSTTIEDVEDFYQFNVWDLNSKCFAWIDDHIRVIPVKRAYINYLF